MLHDVLVGAGFDVQTASHGAEALRMLRAEPPDAIVLDLILPWINGIEVLSIIRADPRLMNVPVIVTTGTPTGDSDLRVFRPVTVMRKPFDIDELVASVQRLLFNHP
jgi:DNA-binding response OmpR family regulator